MCLKYNLISSKKANVCATERTTKIIYHWITHTLSWNSRHTMNETTNMKSNNEVSIYSDSVYLCGNEFRPPIENRNHYLSVRLHMQEALAPVHISILLFATVRFIVNLAQPHRIHFTVILCKRILQLHLIYLYIICLIFILTKKNSSQRRIISSVSI